MDEFIDDEEKLVTLPPKHFLVPKLHFWMLVLGRTDCGKTNHIVDLLFYILRFDRLFLFAADLTESKYKLIIERMRKWEQETGIQKLWVADKVENIVPLDNIDKNYHNIVLFDDFVNVKQVSNGTVYWTASRWNGSCLSLCDNDRQNRKRDAQHGEQQRSVLGVFFVWRMQKRKTSLRFNVSSFCLAATFVVVWVVAKR